jgi:hypothetical protein
MSRYDAAAPQDDETCTGCYGSGWDGNAERFCHCLDGISARKAQEAVQEPPSPGVTAGVTGDTPIGGRVRFAVPAGLTWNDMREWLHTDPKGQSLHQHGDCLLVWANEDDLFATPAPVVPAEGLDSERLVAAWLAETEGFASRQERLMDDILAECDLAPWLHAACQVGIDAALRSAQPVEARVRPLAAIFDAAKAEADKAMRKFPQPNYVISKVAEEAGEVVKAAIHCAENRETKEAVLGEVVQCMAMLIRLCLEGDQVHGLAALLPAGEGEE